MDSIPVNKGKDIMITKNGDSSQENFTPVKEETSGILFIGGPDSHAPLGKLETIPSAERRPSRRSAPAVVRLQTEAEGAPASVEFEQMRARRMSDPGGSLAQFVAADSGDALEGELEASATDQDADEDRQSDWGTFVEAPRWEDWQDFATHGAFTGPVVLDTEEEAAKRLQSLAPYLPQMLAHTALYDPSEFPNKLAVISTQSNNSSPNLLNNSMLVMKVKLTNKFWIKVSLRVGNPGLMFLL